MYELVTYFDIFDERVDRVNIRNSMREIKFRVWDPDQECFIYECEFSSKLQECYWYEGSMRIGVPYIKYGCQYTGLKDKNGKEIYEGDIVNMPNYFLDEFINCEIKDLRVFYLSVRHALIEESELEIIGNIHENPELLEKVK